MASIIQAFNARRESQLMASRSPSTDDLVLENLPTRLDDETLARVRDIAESPLPPPEPCDERHFNQCLRVMLAVLPKRTSDELSGELFVAAYQKKLGDKSKDAISFLADKAMERCQWFPTIAECLEILTDYARWDEHCKRRALAVKLVGKEDRQRLEDKRPFSREWGVPELTQEMVDTMSPEMVRVGLACGGLVEHEGKIIPWSDAPGRDKV